LPEVTNRDQIAAHLEQLKGQIIARWREELRLDPLHAGVIEHFENRRLEDHLPALTGEVIECLRGKAPANIEEDGRRHGQQRRRDGFTVVQVMRELNLYRRVLLNTVDELLAQGAAPEDIVHARRLMLELVDRSVNASVEQFTVEAEEERNLAQEETQALHYQRDRFLITLSHELRNQISPILLNVHLLNDLKPADPRIQQAVMRIARQARHQSVLIDDLLDLSRFQHGSLELKMEAIDLREAVQHAFETLEPDFKLKRLKLQSELPQQALLAHADQTRIAQIVINLLSNAVKFTASEGTITVRLARENDGVILSVKDTGIGITTEALPKVFNMFFQGKSLLKQVSSGLGVGLALAKALVELHGGSIEARSEGENLGAEFIVRLPVPENLPQAEPKKTVLLVDDNPDQLAGLAELLKIREYEVVEAADGQEAIRLASEVKPVACVIDIGMPDMDGYEVARRLRAMPETRGARLIALTGYSMPDRQVFESAGFDRYLRKPADVDELDRILSSRLTARE
jgi:signal transduction histidine kinase/CheY-like chemotaxis protein